MPAIGWSLFTAPEEVVDGEMLRAFLDDQREANLVAESMTLELKVARHGDNVVKAIAGLANADGGIVLVGVPDDVPDLHDLPGVDVREVVQLADQCRALLSPPVQPELIPVALPGRERVVIVVRVSPLVSEGPVVKNGTVFVRAPGQTVPATRDQIVALVHRSERIAAGDREPPHVSTVFNTSAIANTADEPFPDFRLRVASSMVLRAPTPDSLMLGSVQRQGLVDAFASSAFGMEPAAVNMRYRYRDQRPRPITPVRSSSELRVHVDFEDDHDHSIYHVGLAVLRYGPGVVYAVDLEARRASADTRGQTRIGRGELTTALIEGIEFVALTIPGTMSELTAGALKARSSIQVWLDSFGPISETLDLSHLYRPHPQRVGDRWGFQVDPPNTFESICDQVGVELRRLYLDLGVDDEEHVVEQDMSRAIQQRTRTLEMDLR